MHSTKLSTNEKTIHIVSCTNYYGLLGLDCQVDVDVYSRTIRRWTVRWRTLRQWTVRRSFPKGVERYDGTYYSQITMNTTAEPDTLPNNKPGITLVQFRI